MPVAVRKGRKENEWLIVEIETGKVVGRSKTKKDAEASARIRNATLAREQRGR